MWGWLTSVEVLPKFGLDRIMGTAPEFFPIMKMAYFDSLYNEFFWSLQICIIYQKLMLFYQNK